LQPAVSFKSFGGSIVIALCFPSHLSLPFSLRQLSWLMGVAFSSALGVQAQTAPAAPQPAVTLKEVVVSGSRREQSVDDLPMTLDVLDSADIEQGQIRDIRDAVKNIPNVSVRRAPARFALAQGDTGREGNAGFNIRGLEGNRVLMLVDGIRIPRSYAFNANVFGRDTLSIDLIKRIELVKGPASVLYGSDGIAGLVNFITHEPADFLKDGKTLGGRASIGYSGDDRGTAVATTVAGRASELLDWQITAAVNRGQELANKGDSAIVGPRRTAPNPQSDRGNALLGKAVLRPGSGQKHVLTFEHVDKKSDFELLTARAVPVVAPTSVLNANAATTMDRNRVTWDARYRLDAAVADNLQTVLSYQDADARELAFERRNGAADRLRDSNYRERTLQAGIQADTIVRMSAQWAQKFTYGLDHTRAKITNLETGLVPAAGETFPLKRFPDTTESSSALYGQDELIGGNWSITPGLRFDHFSVDASQTGFAVQVVSPSGSAVSPKFGVLYRATPQWSVFGNYAGGFRAPNAGQVNAFFQNATQFYRTIPNPGLKPEKSKNLEFGVRARLDRLTLDSAVFYGRFTNLIQDNVQVAGNFTAQSPTVFQSINIDNATISGFEIRGVMDWGPLGASRLSTPFAYGQARGRVKNTGRPLDTVDPAKLSVGVRFETAGWDVWLDANHHSAKKFEDIGTQLVGTPATPQFAVPAATTLDLGGQWRIGKTVRINAGIANLTDKKYWNWSDVRSVAASSPALDAYTQPGRHFNVSLVADF
jgi:hemoglobin/transferrin/lactoferrin receptor protein